MRNDTIDFYNENAETYFNNTVNLDLSKTYDEFLKNIPKGGTILDVGCGSGNASVYFKKKGYKVKAFDASENLADKASDILGQKVDVFTFDNFNYKIKFDGIWASASLLHAKKSELPKILTKIGSYLKRYGKVYISLKEGEGEKIINNRFFSFYTQKELKKVFEDSKINIKLNKIYYTEDVKKHEKQEEKWLNIIAEESPPYLDLNLDLNSY
jgi:SAM-dependent methyltransferase